MYIDQNNISHIITGYEWKDNKLMGIVETANTRCGQDMKGLIAQGSDVAFSMRGLSSTVRKKGEFQLIEGPLFIVTYDFVIVPSHQDSYITGILSESSNDSILEENDKSLFSKVNMMELLEYASNNSDNVKAMAESIGITIDVEDETQDIKLENNKQLLSFKKDNEVVKCYLEDIVRRNVDSIFKSLY